MPDSYQTAFINRLAQMDNDSLLSTLVRVTAAPSEYQPEAIASVREEVARRGLTPAQQREAADREKQEALNRWQDDRQPQVNDHLGRPATGANAATVAQKRKHDLAYGCFLAPGAVCLIAGIGSAVPMDSGSAGVIGFLVLIPLAIVALGSIPVGIYYSMVLWRDGVLPLLSLLTILMIAELVTEAGSVKFYNASGLVYAILVLILEGSWFLLRRHRFNRA